MEHEDDSNTNCNWRSWNGPQRLEMESGRVRRAVPAYMKLKRNTF